MVKGKKGFQKGHKINLGKKLSEETKRKISQSEKGKILSKDTRKLLEDVLYSKIRNKSYNEIYGIERAQEIKRKMSNSLKGRISPTKGKTHTKERRERMSKMFSGEKNPFYGRKHKKETIDEYKEKRKNWKIPIKDTTIEIKIQKLLTILHIEYFTHKHISEITHSYKCDIFIPTQNGIEQKTIIECDGCYWHGCKICSNEINDYQKDWINRDKLRTKELQKKGYRVIRLWEHDIRKMELNDLKNEL